MVAIKADTRQKPAAARLSGRHRRTLSDLIAATTLTRLPLSLLIIFRTPGRRSARAQDLRCWQAVGRGRPGCGIRPIEAAASQRRRTQSWPRKRPAAPQLSQLPAPPPSLQFWRARRTVRRPRFAPAGPASSVSEPREKKAMISDVVMPSVHQQASSGSRHGRWADSPRHGSQEGTFCRRYTGRCCPSPHAPRV